MKSAAVLASVLLLGGYVDAVGAGEVPAEGEVQRHSSDSRKKYTRECDDEAFPASWERTRSGRMSIQCR